jgi:hypothetical protein
MRYITPTLGLVLYKKNGQTAYKASAAAGITRRYGTFTVGDPTTAVGGGNAIVTGTGNDALQDIFPAESTDAAKAGLGKVFFEAPIISVTGATNLTASRRYDVLIGSIVYKDKLYVQGDFFETDTVVAVNIPNGGTAAQVALSVPVSANAYVETAPQQFTEAARLANPESALRLENGGNWNPYSQSGFVLTTVDKNFGYTRG